MAFLDSTGVTRLATDLKAKFAAITHNHAAGDITSGTLPVARGGTGVTANPSMLTNLESTVADTVFEATPRPGVTGTLPVANGGTGKATHTANAVLTGDGGNAVKNVATADGALYATAANGAATFGTLPIAQGGTAGTTKTEARQSLEVPVNSSIAPVESVTATSNHSAGDYFMLGDMLMVATSAIATGETINTSNATTATVQSQIDAIRDSLSPTSVTLATNIYLTRCANIRMLRIEAQASVINGGIVLDQSDRPQSLCHFLGIRQVGWSFITMAAVDVSNNGAISCSAALSYNTSESWTSNPTGLITCTAMWMVG